MFFHESDGVCGVEGRGWTRPYMTAGDENTSFVIGIRRTAQRGLMTAHLYRLKRLRDSLVVVEGPPLSVGKRGCSDT